jgi:hypothetical protein
MVDEIDYFVLMFSFFCDERFCNTYVGVHKTFQYPFLGLKIVAKYGIIVTCGHLILISRPFLFRQ